MSDQRWKCLPSVVRGCGQALDSWPAAKIVCVSKHGGKEEARRVIGVGVVRVHTWLLACGDTTC